MVNASPQACNLRASVYQIHGISGLCRWSQPNVNIVLVKLEHCEEMNHFSVLFLLGAYDQENVSSE